MPWSEKQSLQFRWEVFNITNSVRFDVQSANGYVGGSLANGDSANFGNFSGTSPTRASCSSRYATNSDSCANKKSGSLTLPDFEASLKARILSRACSIRNSRESRAGEAYDVRASGLNSRSEYDLYFCTGNVFLKNAMRMLLRVSIPVEAGNAAAKAGNLGPLGFISSAADFAVRSTRLTATRTEAKRRVKPRAGLSLLADIFFVEGELTSNGYHLTCQ